jgi:hypothetical protein
MERLNTIHCLGRPLTTTGAVDDDGILPVAALQQLCAHLTTRFGRLAELQVSAAHHMQPLSLVLLLSQQFPNKYIPRNTASSRGGEAGSCFLRSYSM